jgi:hypothetical protein
MTNQQAERATLTGRRAMTRVIDSAEPLGKDELRGLAGHGWVLSDVQPMTNPRTRETYKRFTFTRAASVEPENRSVQPTNTGSAINAH